MAGSLEFMHSDETLTKIICVEFIHVTGLSRIFSLIFQMSGKAVVLAAGL